MANSLLSLSFGLDDLRFIHSSNNIGTPTTLSNASSYFFLASGLDPSNAYAMAFSQYALGAVCVVLSWTAMTTFGRRTLYVYGIAFLCLIIFTVGGIPLVLGALDHENSNPTASLATASMLMFFTFIYYFAVGSVYHCLVSEISSIRLQQKTAVLARTLFNLIGLAMGFVILYMVHPKAWNMMGHSGFVWASSALLCFLWALFRLSEPKNRTFAEFDVLFEKKISARKIRETQVDLLNRDEVEHIGVGMKHWSGYSHCGM